MTAVSQLFSLKGRTALVTGGSSGLGLQIAEALGTQGARVVISSRKAESLEQAASHLKGLDIDAAWIAADSAKEEDVERLATQAMERLGRIDILVNNAGATWGASTADHPLTAWDKVMNLNVRSMRWASSRRLHSGASFWNFSASSRVSGGTPPRQGVHVLAARASAIASTPNV